MFQTYICNLVRHYPIRSISVEDLRHIFHTYIIYLIKRWQYVFSLYLVGTGVTQLVIKLQVFLDQLCVYERERESYCYVVGTGKIFFWNISCRKTFYFRLPSGQKLLLWGSTGNSYTPMTSLSFFISPPTLHPFINLTGKTWILCQLVWFQGIHFNDSFKR